MPQSLIFKKNVVEKWTMNVSDSLNPSNKRGSWTWDLYTSLVDRSHSKWGGPGEALLPVVTEQVYTQFLKPNKDG